MTEPDNSSQNTQNACVETAIVRTLSPEQLRKWLNDRRNAAQKARFDLLVIVKAKEKEIAAYDALLADLTIG